MEGNIFQMVKVLRENYSLGELEERLNLRTEDLKDGLDVLVDERYEEINEMLKEDLWFI